MILRQPWADIGFAHHAYELQRDPATPAAHQNLESPETGSKPFAQPQERS
jgi:hypothetical protein